MASLPARDDNWAYAAAFSPDGMLIVTAEQRGDFHSWSAATTDHIRHLNWHFQKANDLAFRAGGAEVLSTTRDLVAVLTDIATGGKIAELTGHTQDVTDVAVSPDGAVAVTGS